MLSVAIGFWPWGSAFCLGAAAGPGVWFAVGEKYEASSYLRVSMQDKGILNEQAGAGVDRDRFEIYKNTQQQLVQGRFVLMAALRKPDVIKLASVQEAQKKGDVTGWLMKWLSVGFPGRAEIMEIRVSRYNAKEAATLAKAVVDAYISEVVNTERDEKRNRQIELDPDVR